MTIHLGYGVHISTGNLEELWSIIHALPGATIYVDKFLRPSKLATDPKDDEFELRWILRLTFDRDGRSYEFIEPLNNVEKPFDQRSVTAAIRYLKSSLRHQLPEVFPKSSNAS